MKNIDLPMLLVWVAGISLSLCPCVLFFLAKMIGIL